MPSQDLPVLKVDDFVTLAPAETDRAIFFVGVTILVPAFLLATRSKLVPFDRVFVSRLAVEVDSRALLGGTSSCCNSRMARSADENTSCEAFSWV